MSDVGMKPWRDRKAAFKTPPPQVRDASASQEQRRKKRRAERFDSSRQLDLFSDLNLGPSDEEGDELQDESAPPNSSNIIIREGISAFASMLAPSGASSSAVPEVTSSFTITTTSESVPHARAGDVQTNGKKRGRNKRKGKARSSTGGVATSSSTKPQSSSTNTKPGKWADKCMYAELLEMNEEHRSIGGSDGIPDDIETGWVAVTPVPAGKRCLAITHAASGIAGIVPNTTLRSRVLGKALMKPFPSPLPPNTVLDCILDDNWHANGVLHVLDVLKWKGQDIADCETPFRFWWRDTRLSELVSFPPPPSAPEKTTPSHPHSRQYQFPYPTTYVAIPYHQDTSLTHLLTTLIPQTRTTRSMTISIPALASSGDMDLDIPNQPMAKLHSVMSEIKPDGILLYDSQATYEPGTSPLSIWVPIRSYVEESWKEGKAMTMQDGASSDGPLDKFERLIRRKLEARSGLHSEETSMEM